MTQWKDSKEKRIPFMARGNGRMHDLSQRVEELAETINSQIRMLPVKEMPAQPDKNLVYLIYEETDDNDEMP